MKFQFEKTSNKKVIAKKPLKNLYINMKWTVVSKVLFSFPGDAICNAGGFGFNGYDKNGKAKWDLITNVNILGIEVRVWAPCC